MYQHIPTALWRTVSISRMSQARRNMIHASCDYGVYQSNGATRGTDAHTDTRNRDVNRRFAVHSPGADHMHITCEVVASISIEKPHHSATPCSLELRGGL